MTSATTNHHATAEAAIAFICARFRLSPKQLISRNREFTILWPRWCAIHLVKKHTGWGLTRLARHFNVYEGTIRNALQGVQNQIQTSTLHRDQLAVIEREFKP